MHTESRLHRVLGGLSIGYVTLLLNMVVGLWLTPFLIGSLGSHTYGLWLVSLQLLGYLALLDIGVLALVPRETAAAPATVLGDVVGDLRTLTRWQAPFIALAGLALLGWMPGQWHELRGPFAVTLTAYVLLFPLRTYAGVLQGLQDLAFVGRWQLATWAVGTVVLIGAAYGGTGLMAPVLGWVVGQASFAAVCRWRVHRHFPQSVAPPAPRVSLALARRYLGRGMWVSVSQVAQILTNGTDLLLVARLLSPASAVIYSCTSKLCAVLINPPQLLLHLAQPAMSEIGARQDPRRFLDVFGAVVQSVLILSGGLALAIWAVNELFVAWWVGPEQFGGSQVTAALVVAFVLRHTTVSLNYAAFCVGGERRLAGTVLTEGILAVGAGALLLLWIGLPGAALAAGATAMLVNVPMNARTIAARLGVSVGLVFAPYLAWLRQASLGGLILMGAWWLVPGWQEHAALRLALCAAVYAAVMLPLGFRAPLAPYRPAVLSYVMGRSRGGVSAAPASSGVAIES